MSSGEGLGPERQPTWEELVQQGLSDTFSEIEDIMRPYPYQLPDHELLEILIQRSFDEIDQGYILQTLREIEEDEEAMPKPCITEYRQRRKPHQDGDPLSEDEQAAWDSITQAYNHLSLKRNTFPRHDLDGSRGGYVYVPLILQEMAKMDDE